MLDFDSKNYDLRRYACTTDGCKYKNWSTWYPSSPDEVPECDSCKTECKPISY